MYIEGDWSFSEFVVSDSNCNLLHWSRYVAEISSSEEGEV